MLITFEGVEGAGKSTQIARLAERLVRAGRSDVLTTREPGDGPLGPDLRRLVLQPPGGAVLDERTELLLMLADRAQHVAAVLRPALARGAIVLCDRYVDSSIAYQGWGRGLAVDQIAGWNAWATQGLVPDRTILLDLDPAVGLARQARRTRMEDESLAFHGRVREGFLALAQAEPGRFVVLDSSQEAGAVHAQVWAALAPLLPAEPLGREDGSQPT